MAAEVTFRKLEIPESVIDIAQKLESAGYEAWCVGGNLRDALLQIPHSDYDIATSATPDQVQKLFPRTIEVGIKYGTVGVLDRSRVLHEVTTFRRDVITDGRHAVVAFGASLEEDLSRRDFTINALAYHPLRGEWRDPFHGAADIDSRLVRAVGHPPDRFREDYLRILRAIRFAARFDFSIDPETWDAARAAAPGLRQLSAERVRDEWFKSLRTARSITQLVLLWIHAGAASAWIPELEGVAGFDNAFSDPPPDKRDPVVLTTLLCRDPVAVLRRLKASNAEIARAEAMLKGPEEPSALDQRSIRRWLAVVGSAADDLAHLWRLRQGEDPAWSAAAAEIRGRGDPLTRGDLAITGGDLQALGITGPRVGETLAALLERVLDDPSINTRDSLLTLARSMG
jgi:tRNA nucleotidyltransferase (CCA-adding enzyme)